MKVLFLSVSAGNGHNATCQALMEELEQRGVNCRLADAMRYIGRAVAAINDKGYMFMTLRTPEAFGKLYSTALKSSEMTSSKTIRRIGELLLTEKLIRLVRLNNPDVIVCSHPFPAIFACEINRVLERNTPLIGIITDFTLHPYWEHVDMDAYVVSSPQLMYHLEKKGIRREKVITSGIPVNTKFSSSIPKAEARAQLGLADKPTLLVMSGSIGYSSTVDAVRKIDAMREDIQVITVCGNNARIKSRIDELNLSSVALNYGFTKNVDLLMDAADVLLTKPGGLTSSECMTKRLPMLLFSPIPGQEDHNLEYLLNHGMAMALSDLLPVDEAIMQLLFSPERLELMRKAQEAFAFPEPTRSLCDYMCERWG